MKRPTVLLVAIVVLCGCRAPQGSAVDPFFGQTRVKPPSTDRVVVQPPGDSYYRDAPGAALPSNKTWAATSSIGYTPPGGYKYSGEVVERSRALGTSGSRVTVPQSAIREERTKKSSKMVGTRSNEPFQPIEHKQDWSTNVSTATPSAVAFARSPTSPTNSNASIAPTLANRERIVRIIEPRSSNVMKASASELVPAEPRPHRLVSSNKVIDIMELPKASKPKKHGFYSKAVQPAVAVCAVDDVKEKQSQAASFSSPSKYGYDREYTRLKGKLEYSQIDHQWKLRYVPIDGNTDKYGGSVVLPDSTLLSEYERGDFVEIQGKLGEQVEKERGFAPLYDVTEVKRLGS